MTHNENANKDLAQAGGATEMTQEKTESELLRHLITALTALVIALLVLTAYHVTIAQSNRQRYAVVDIAEVLNIKEMQVTIAAMTPGASDEMKAKAYEDIEGFGRTVETVLADLQQECGCSIFVKAAVVKPGQSEDLTPELKRRLGMENTSVQQLTQRLRTLGGQGTPPQLENQPK